MGLDWFTSTNSNIQIARYGRNGTRTLWLMPTHLDGNGMSSGTPDDRKKTPEQLAAAVVAGEVTETIDGTPIRELYRSPDGHYRGYVWDMSISKFKPRVWDKYGGTAEGISVGEALCSNSAVYQRERKYRIKKQ